MPRGHILSDRRVRKYAKNAFSQQDNTKCGRTFCVEGDLFSPVFAVKFDLLFFADFGLAGLNLSS